MGRWLLAAVVGADVVWLVTRPHVHGRWMWVPLLAALGAHLALVEQQVRRPSLTRRQVLLASAVVAVVAVAIPVFGSHDLYLYAFSGRMLGVHHVNPYLTSPDRFSTDPLLQSVAPAWWSRGTAYGPLFTVISAVGSPGFATSPTLARLYFQGLDAAALLLALAVLAARRCPPHVLVFLGLSPAVLAVVNGGHNDLLAGVLLLFGVLALGDRRVVLAGALLAGAVMIKLLVVPGVAAVLVAVALDRRRADAIRAGAIVLGATVAGYLAFGGPAALAPLAGTNGAMSRGSIWHGVIELLRGSSASIRLTEASVQRLALVAVLSVGLAFVLRLRRPVDPAAAMVGALLIFLFATQYVMPWYSTLVLPAAALLAQRARLIAHAQAVLLLLLYVVPPGSLISGVPDLTGLGQITPWVQLAFLVILALWWPRRAGQSGSRGTLSA